MKRLTWTLSALLALAVSAGSGRADAGDVTAFLTLPAPTDTWGRGYGAALTSTWFQALSFEAEAARLPGDLTDASMTSFTASAFLAPPIGAFTPYAGMGVGVFRQTVSTDSDVGTLKAYALGVKVKIGLVVVKGEYRKVSVPQWISPEGFCRYSQNIVPHSASSRMSGTRLPLPTMLNVLSNRSGRLNWSSVNRAGNAS